MSTQREMVELLRRYGDGYSGGPDGIEATAAAWLAAGFTPLEVERWLAIDVWDAEAAAAFRNAGLSPQEACRGADRLLDEDPEQNDPLYAVCNGDILPAVIIEAAKAD